MSGSKNNPEPISSVPAGIPVLAPEAIELVESGAPPGMIRSEHVIALVEAAKVAIDGARSFDVRWAADMRAIKRWQAGDDLTEWDRSILTRAQIQLGNGQLAGEIAERLKCEKSDAKKLIWPDHADLVVWLLDLFDRSISEDQIEHAKVAIDRLKSAGQIMDSLLVGDLLSIATSTMARDLANDTRYQIMEALLMEAFGLFRMYEGEHLAKVTGLQRAVDAGSPDNAFTVAQKELIEKTLIKADRNGELAERIGKLFPPSVIALIEEGRPLGMLDAIEYLRNYDEGDSVTIMCDNPDEGPARAVECCGHWTGWADQRYTGETLLAAINYDNQPAEPFERGQRIRKIRGHDFGQGDAEVVACYRTKAGAWRVVAEHPEGWQFIFEPNQIEPIPHDELSIEIPNSSEKRNWESATAAARHLREVANVLRQGQRVPIGADSMRELAGFLEANNNG